MKRRLLSAAVAFIMVFNLVLVPDGIAVFNSGAATEGDWEYTVDYGAQTVMVTKYNGVLTTVTVPSEIDGKKVTIVGSASHSVFGGSVKSVIIPNGVTAIMPDAFYGCSSLTSVTIPNSVTSIGSMAFQSCTDLKSLTIPNSVTSIGPSAFKDCVSLTSVTIGSGVTSIGVSAFGGCVSLKSLTIPNSVKTIGDFAFRLCSSLTTVKIGSGVTSIGDAFDDCSSLTKINVNASNANYSSENGVLFNKAKTTLIEYPQGKTSNSYTIPSGVKTIGDSAFEACLYLNAVTIPKSVTSVEKRAFLDCTYLILVTFKSSTPPSLGTDVFSWCQRLTTIAVPKSAKAAYQNAIPPAYAFAGSYSICGIYKITYELGSSKAKNSSSNPTTYIQSYGATLKKPTRSGYAFAGWYTKSNFSSSSKITSISSTSAKNITLYAKWVKLPTKPTSVKAKANSKSKITVTWKKVSGADGYEVYRATSKNGTYKKVKTVSKGSTVKYANKSLTSNKTYYYKVRAYKLVDGKKVYGEYSSIKSAKTQK